MWLVASRLWTVGGGQLWAVSGVWIMGGGGSGHAKLGKTKSELEINAKSRGHLKNKTNQHNAMDSKAKQRNVTQRQAGTCHGKLVLPPRRHKAKEIKAQHRKGKQNKSKQNNAMQKLLHVRKAEQSNAKQSKAKQSKAKQKLATVGKQH